MKDTQLIQEVKEALHVVATTSGNKRYDALERLKDGAEGWLDRLVDALEEANRTIADKDTHIKALRESRDYEIKRHEDSCIAYQDKLLAADEALADKDRENERLQQVNHLYGAFIAELSENTVESIADQCRNVLKQGGEVSRDVPTAQNTDSR